MQFLSIANLTILLQGLKEDYEVYLPVKKVDQRFYKKFEGYRDDITIGEVRPFEPLKAFFTPAREKVADDFSPDIPALSDKPFCIVGVKPCDLKGLKVLDYVFTNHDYQDPFYMRMRQNNLIISSDCTGVLDTCFCLAVDVRPYPQENFDINLSEIKDGFIVEAGSSKGEALIKKYSSLFEKADEKLIAERDEEREKITKKVEKNIKENGPPQQNLYKGIIEKNYDADLWKEEAKTCLECGACNVICPTCHCFLLYDQKSKEKMARLKIWDSCIFADFARVAGGANPRKKLWMRLRNRFEKKFDFFPKVAGIYACTGCGRCIFGCPAKIDIRRVLKKLAE